MGSTTPTKYALITGGLSGIGYNLVKHLYSQTAIQWKIIIGDIRPEAWTSISSEFDTSRVHFVQCNVASWDSHAALFSDAFSWSNGRIDFYAANAGTADKELVGGPQDLSSPPQKPNLIAIEVCEIGVFYGLKLFIYYSRKTQQGNAANFNPKLVITSSCSAFYPFPAAPQYASAKHSLVGLTRSVGARLFAQDNIAVNCVCPAFIDTGLIPPALLEAWPQKWVTPFSTLNRAFSELIDEDGKVEQDGKSEGEHGVVKTGQAVEVVVDNLFYRKPVEYPDESQRFLIEESIKPDGLWSTEMGKSEAKTQITW